MKKQLARFFRKRSMVNAAPFRCGLPAHLRECVRRLPKSEIHVHLEGCLEPALLLELAKKYRAPELRTLADAQWALYFSQPNEFFRQFLCVSSFLREPDDFRRLAFETAKRMRGENVQYVEFTFAPHKFLRAGMRCAVLLEAIDRGLREAYFGAKFSYGLVIDIVRDLGPKAGMEMIRIMEDNPRPNVVGIGLGGGETYLPEASAAVFEYAASLGLRKTAHAGEGRGANSVWGAIRSLKPERIDHGLRSYEDPALLDYLREKQIPLNLCLTSNIQLGVCRSYQCHPFRAYYDMGIPVNISTDDPAFFHTTLCQEIEKLIEFQGFAIDEIPGLMENSLRASFLADEQKRDYIASFKKESQDILNAFQSEFGAKGNG